MHNQFLQNILETVPASNNVFDNHQFAELKKKAMKNIEQNGLPTNSTENWRTSECSTIYLSKYTKARFDYKFTHSKQWWEKQFEKSARVVFFNGRVEAENITVDASKITFENYSPFQNTVNFSFKNLLGNDYDLQNTFIDINLLTTESVHVLEITKDIEAENPILITHLIDESLGNINLSSRIIIKVKKDVTANLIEGFASASKAGYLNNSVLHILLEDGAVMNFTRVQGNGLNARQMDNVIVEQSRDSKFNYNYFDYGGLYSHSSLYANLNGTGAECIINGLYLGKEKQFHGFRSKINHSKPHCHSNENIKGIVKDESRAMFHGLIHVAEGADKTTAYQQHDALLLSQKAFSTSQPQLEIFTDDVACSHGSTVGQLNDKELFYLMSRGIDKNSAYNILTASFAKSVIEEFTSAKLKPVLAQYCESFFDVRN